MQFVLRVFSFCLNILKCARRLSAAAARTTQFVLNHVILLSTRKGMSLLFACAWEGVKTKQRGRLFLKRNTLIGCLTSCCWHDSERKTFTLPSSVRWCFQENGGFVLLPRSQLIWESLLFFFFSLTAEEMLFTSAAYFSLICFKNVVSFVGN